MIVLEDLERYKVILLRSNSTTADKINALQQLSKKTPSIAILNSTGIGKLAYLGLIILNSASLFDFKVGMASYVSQMEKKRNIV